MEILVNQTVGSKKEDVFGLFDNGNSLIRNDKETLLSVRDKLKDAIKVVEYWLDSYT